MPTYTVKFKDEVITRLESDAETIRVGRAEDCDVRIDNLGVSRYHVTVEVNNGVRVLRDLGSHNGVYFNGKLVKSRVLNDGDVFVIGKYRLEYRGDSADGVKTESASASADPYDKVDDGLMRTFAIDPGSIAHLRQAEQVKGYLRRKDGKYVDLRQTITTFGKYTRCDHRLDGFFMPRVVGVIVRDERGFILLNVTGNPDKVRVQGRPLSLYVRLENGFTILLGGHEFTYHSGRPVER